MNPKKIAQFLKGFLKLWKNKGILIIFLLIAIYLTFFLLSPYILKHLQTSYNQKFVFYSVSEPLVSLLKFSLVLTFILLFPFLWYFLISFFNFLYSFKKSHFWLFYVLGLFLFYLGVVFCYEVTLPFGIKFLISFKTEKIEPAISLGHFVNFFSFFILAFGLIFELPLFICFLSMGRIINPSKLGSYRKEIFFIIVVIAALVTPTPDAFNMSLLAIPLYILFELGLFLSKLIQKSETTLNTSNTPLEDNQKELQKD
ncbi:Sec-independent periplasmic protein translocase [Thermodesulfobacterium geofontis OPF15]|jgi:sec-independent protein translocase protein TatC|uniref:Sec-independent protein translocase protein TatC n=1 Tax=Thermodesulfobacterium geofontis (strain OPF15) TaxID=795359 RepID=F8C230_THEGP|nr:twin-arginine translocase subunit TatC [Thermodesulfobacterium geofontis]AEH22182.1 Sec-independent periplasmic protein translocase [Thermodesulfobacterium geofontis OPF15]